MNKLKCASRKDSRMLVLVILQSISSRVTHKFSFYAFLFNSGVTFEHVSQSLDGNVCAHGFNYLSCFSV